VELLRVSKKSRGQIASDLGVSETTLANWVKKRAVKEEMVERTLSLTERQELDQLRGEKREWVLEREVLKKATAFWVKESNA
jgi:transposase